MAGGEAPANFEFTLKAWQLITHPPSSPTYRRAGLSIPAGGEGRYGFFRPTAEVLEAWRRTREVTRALRARVVVFQCPASFREGREPLYGGVRCFRLHGGPRYRHRYTDEELRGLAGLGVERVVDVRGFPTSRFDHFKGEELARLLREVGMAYLYLGDELGGYRSEGY